IVESEDRCASPPNPGTGSSDPGEIWAHSGLRKASGRAGPELHKSEPASNERPCCPEKRLPPVRLQKPPCRGHPGERIGKPERIQLLQREDSGLDTPRPETYLCDRLPRPLVACWRGGRRSRDSSIGGMALAPAPTPRA